MLDLITSNDFRRIFTNKYVVFFGDSVVRGMYKDFIQLIQADQLLSDADRKAGGSFESFLNDTLLEGGTYKEVSNATDYEESRAYHSNCYLVKYHFMTRCLNSFVERMLCDIQKDTIKPDVVILNSGLWDLSRYGGKGEEEFKEKLQELFELLKTCITSKTIVIWLTSLPISAEPKPSVLKVQYHPENIYYRTHYLDMNRFTSTLAKQYDYEVLDLHYLFRQHPELRDEDGCHWNSEGHRMITSFISQYCSILWHMAYIEKFTSQNKQKDAYKLCKHLLSTIIVHENTNDDNNSDKNNNNYNNNTTTTISTVEQMDEEFDLSALVGLRSGSTNENVGDTTEIPGMVKSVKEMMDYYEKI